MIDLAFTVAPSRVRVISLSNLFDVNTFNNNIVNLTKALQASNLLTSYMPAPQGTSEDIANNALASIINPTYNSSKGI